jgi:hypothetical protein
VVIVGAGTSGPLSAVSYFANDRDLRDVDCSLDAP